MKNWISYLMAYLEGFFMFSICTVGLNLGVEVAYPVGEPYSVGVLFCSGSFCCIIFSVSSTYLLSNTENKVWAVRLVYTLMTFYSLVGTIFSFFVTEDLRRLKIESKKLELRAERGEVDKYGSFRSKRTNKTDDDLREPRVTANFNEE